MQPSQHIDVYAILALKCVNSNQFAILLRKKLIWTRQPSEIEAMTRAIENPEHTELDVDEAM